LFYTWDKPSEWLQRFHLDAYRQTSDRQFNTYWSQITGTEKTTFTESELLTTGALMQFDFQLGNHYLITGAQYTHDEVQQDRIEQLNQRVPFPATIDTAVYDQANLETKALFLQDEWQLSDALAITTGVRQYWVSSELEESSRSGLATPPKDDSELIAAIAATWEVAEGSVLRAGFSEGYMYPSLLQLAIGAVASTFVNPNATLDPEKSKTYELGWRYSNNNWQSDLTLFKTDSKNYIDRVSCSPSPNCIGGSRRTPAEIYVNIGEANTTGIEAQLQYLVTDNLTGYTSLTWIKRKHQYDTFSSYKSGLAALSGTAGIKYNSQLNSLGDYWLDLYARGETSADEIEQDGSEHHNAGWVTANAVAGLSFGKNQNYQLVIELNNLFDNSYSSAAENLWSAERNVHAKLTLNF
jgi:hemoglobin/transferrin/lactoferrin receptor protein